MCMRRRYQVHVGEYGAHWNFFVTLSVVAAVTTTLGRAPTLPGRRRRMGEGGVAWGSALLSAAILSVHQLALSGAGLNHWVNREERDPDSILDLNKEGIVSSVGTPTRRHPPCLALSCPVLPDADATDAPKRRLTLLATCLSPAGCTRVPDRVREYLLRWGSRGCLLLVSV